MIEVVRALSGQTRELIHDRITGRSVAGQASGGLRRAAGHIAPNRLDAAQINITARIGRVWQPCRGQYREHYGGNEPSTVLHQAFAWNIHGATHSFIEIKTPTKFSL